MGVASGGLFRTTDGGANWVPITDGKIPVGSMGSIAVADSDPNVIYVGTGSDGVRSNVSTGRGVYKTTDGGETWQFVGLYDAGQIGAVRIHPTNPDIVWVAAMGDAFKTNAERGIFKTTDGGKTWKKVLFVNDGVGAMDVELQPGNPDCRVRVDVAPRAQAVDDHQRLERRRLLQEHRRRRDVHEDRDRPSDGTDRQGQPRGDGRKARSHLRADRSAAGRRVLSLRRRGQTLGADQPAGVAAAAAVLLHDARRRSHERGRRLRGRRGLLQVDRRRQDVHGAAHAARRQPRHLDQPEGRQHHDPVERRRRQRLDSTAAARGRRR